MLFCRQITVATWLAQQGYVVVVRVDYLMPTLRPDVIWCTKCSCYYSVNSKHNCVSQPQDASPERLKGSTKKKEEGE